MSDQRSASYVVAPREPLEIMWNGLARDLMMWLDQGDSRTPRSLLEHLSHCGRTIPQWLFDEPEMKSLDHSISKGTRCVIIYKAMLGDMNQQEGEPIDFHEEVRKAQAEVATWSKEKRDSVQLEGRTDCGSLP